MEFAISPTLPLPHYRSIGAPVALTSEYLAQQDPMFRSDAWAWIATRYYFVPIPAALATFWWEHRVTSASFEEWKAILRTTFAASAHLGYAHARSPIAMCAALGIIAPWPWDPRMSQYPYDDANVVLAHNPDHLDADPWHLEPEEWHHAITLSAFRQSFPRSWPDRLAQFLADPRNLWMVAAQPFERDLICQRAGIVL